MRILIADDHSVVREGLKSILNGIKDITSIDETRDGNETLQKIMANEFDFIILDISMPLLSGLDILQILKSRDKKVNVLILSIHSQEQYAIRSFRLGASGYICKDSASEELENAINKISSGEKYISSVIAEKLAFNFNEKERVPLHERLSEREFQVMCLLAKGIPVREIGKIIFISEKTVSTHRTRLLKKMGMKRNSELILYAIKNDLIE